MWDIEKIRENSIFEGLTRMPSDSITIYYIINTHTHPHIHGFPWLIACRMKPLIVITVTYIGIYAKGICVKSPGFFWDG